MFGNYVKNLFRHIQRHSSYFFINLTGLTLGLVCVMLVLVYVRFEFSFDKFHPHYDRIYRPLVLQDHEYQGKNEAAVVPPAFGPALKDNIPEVEEVCRVIDWGMDVEVEGEVDNQPGREEGIGMVDPSFLTLFHFPLIMGDKRSALDDLFSIVISESMAQKYFGSEDPMGKTMLLNGEYACAVTGVMEDFPQNSYFQYDFLVPFTLLDRVRRPGYTTEWDNFNSVTFFRLASGVSTDYVEEKIEAFFTGNRPEFITGCKIQPLSQVHFYTRALFEKTPPADIRTIFTLSGIGLAVLLIACFNYINMATARASTRAREICVRKVAGAERGMLIRQFMSESLGFTLMAGVFSLGLTALLLPRFGSYVGHDFTVNTLFISGNLLIMAAVTLTAGLGAGLYPAMLLSSFSPVALMRGGRLSQTGGKPMLRNTLVLIQFFFTIALLLVTFVMSRQLKYIQNKELGYVKDHVLTINAWNMPMDMDVVRQELLSHPGILDMALSHQLPSYISNAKLPDWTGKPESDHTPFFFMQVDEHFLDFYGIPVVQGSAFFSDRRADLQHAIMLNETAVKSIGWQAPLEQTLSFRVGENANTDHPVIGVFPDFHFAPLHLSIAPLILMLKPDECRMISLKLQPGQIEPALRFIEDKWAVWMPGNPVHYSFLDERLDRMYRTDRRLHQSIQYLTLVAVLLACIGLVGLASFSIGRRTREVAVRKVLGASVGGITLLLAREFLRWVILANVAAWPAGFFLASGWLRNFAFRITLSWWMFFIPGLAAMFISLLTVGYHALRAAMSNPVESLKYE